MRVVVTGGSGRLGQSVVTALTAAGHEALSVDRAAVDRLSCRQAQIDLRDLAATKELFTSFAPDAVVHLAAIAVPFSAPEDVILATNTQLAYSVFDAAVAAGARAVLAASSPTVLGYGSPTGWTARSLPLDEDAPRLPWNAYALSKQLIEDMIGMFVRRVGDGVRFGSFRPCFVISPEEWAGAPTQQGHTLEERLADPALAAVSLFNYLDARDAGEFVVAWLETKRPVPNGTGFFVGASDALAVKPVAQLWREYAPQLGESASALTGTEPVFSSSRAERLLGWRPRRSWRTELPADAVARLTGASAPESTPEPNRIEPHDV
ncbi:NAD-dependent epimerase/dehydratase family protein [Lysobacter korlensis]|uniref:NAD-dependent epimerase/dehydratase family protein n=1 Tax=Lysobacter korlensis TaxID=553636 RepID=A0ABV6RTB2_9GAMM